MTTTPKQEQRIESAMATLEDRFGRLGSIEMLCELDCMLALPQSALWLEAIRRKRDLIQNDLNHWK